MAIRSTKEIYTVLENALRESSEALTCVALMDLPEVRAAAVAEYGKDIRVTTNKVSDALGHMWRRNLLTRFPAADTTTLARYAYKWINTTQKVTPLPPSPLLSKKMGILVVEHEDGIRIEFDKFTVTVQPK